jgi:hypothetical protein
MPVDFLAAADALVGNAFWGVDLFLFGDLSVLVGDLAGDFVTWDLADGLVDNFLPACSFACIAGVLSSDLIELSSSSDSVVAVAWIVGIAASPLP